MRRVAAGRHLIDKRLQQLHGLLEIVGAVGQHAAIQLRLLGWKLIELRGYASVLVIGKEILDARVESRDRSKFRSAVAFPRRAAAVEGTTAARRELAIAAPIAAVPAGLSAAPAAVLPAA